jgi:hypothetical protein
MLVLAPPARAADPAHVEQLLQTRKCPERELSRADLRGWMLEWNDLKRVNLVESELERRRLYEARMEKLQRLLRAWMRNRPRPILDY